MKNNSFWKVMLLWKKTWIWKKLTHNQKNWSLLDGMHLEYTYDSLWHMESIYYWNTTAQINQTSNS